MSQKAGKKKRNKDYKKIMLEFHPLMKYATYTHRKYTKSNYSLKLHKKNTW